MVEGEDQLPQVVLWPPHTRWHVHTHTYIKKQWISFWKSKCSGCVTASSLPSTPCCDWLTSSTFSSASVTRQQLRTRVQETTTQLSQHASPTAGARPVCSETGVVDGSLSISKSVSALPSCSLSDKKLGQIHLYVAKQPVIISVRTAPSSASECHKIIPFSWSNVSVCVCRNKSCLVSWFVSLFVSEGYLIFPPFAFQRQEHSHVCPRQNSRFLLCSAPWTTHTLPKAYCWTQLYSPAWKMHFQSSPVLVVVLRNWKFKIPLLTILLSQPQGFKIIGLSNHTQPHLQLSMTSPP